jgi:hypothetical protein
MPKDGLKLFLHPNGSVVILPKVPVSALLGILKSRRRRAPTVEEMNQAITEGARGVCRSKTRG